MRIIKNNKKNIKNKKQERQRLVKDRLDASKGLVVVMRYHLKMSANEICLWLTALTGQCFLQKYLYAYLKELEEGELLSDWLNNIYPYIKQYDEEVGLILYDINVANSFLHLQRTKKSLTALEWLKSHHYAIALLLDQQGFSQFDVCRIIKKCGFRKISLSTLKRYLKSNHNQ